MSARVAIVIPTRNEEYWIESSIQSAFDAGAVEVIVSDGGSVDGTISRARAAGANVIETEGPRSRQLNAGFDATKAEIVCFLHADTTLPASACQAIAKSIDGGNEFGGFLLRFVEDDRRLRLAAFMINLRTRLTRAPWGDQAQFFRRDAFEDAGRYAAVPIMEDYDMALRMKRRSRPDVLPLRVATSGRRFLELGVMRTVVTNWRIVLGWHMGKAPDSLRKLYGSR